jgi:hypothetical protein
MHRLAKQPAHLREYNAMGAVFAKSSTLRISPTLVYLDLNKWVDLAKADVCKPDGEKYQRALRTAEQLVSAGEAIFPLSSAHFMEVAKIRDNGRRRELVKLMVKLSDGWFLVSASYLLISALRRAVAVQFQQPLSDEATAPVSRGLKLAFIVPDKPVDVDFYVTNSPIMLEELLATARVNSEFLQRWDSFAVKHEAGRAQLWDLSRAVRKRTYCARVTGRIGDRLAAVLEDFRLGLNDLYALGPNRCMELLELVPFLDVEINLHFERNQHRDRKIAPNDEIDLGLLSLAVPSCQVVVTEQFWAALVQRTKFDAKYGTRVCHDVNEAIMGIGAT